MFLQLGAIIFVTTVASKICHLVTIRIGWMNKMAEGDEYLDLCDKWLSG